MPKGKRKADDFNRDECFDIICFYAGQGDCTMIRCPDGKIIMIDCGSTSGLEQDYKSIIINQVRDSKWAGYKGRIDALILTHSDYDHYNQVKALLIDSKSGSSPEYRRLVIDKIYVSNAYTDTSPLGNYKGGLSATVYSTYFSTTAIYEVTINSPSSNFVKCWYSTHAFKTLEETQAITSRELIVFEGTTASKVTWKVSIVAGNVEKMTGTIKGIGKDCMDGSTIVNAKSLVTKLQIGANTKALFCGDTTFSTEAFLLTNQSSLIKGASLIAAPHHGSEEASSPKFVTTVGASTIVVSAALSEHKHRHPRKSSLDLWKGVASTDTLHLLDSWDNDQDAAYDTSIKWSNAKNPVTMGKTASYRILDTIPPVPPSECYAVTANGSLYREQTDKQIRATAFAITPGNAATPGQFVTYQLSPK